MALWHLCLVRCREVRGTNAQQLNGVDLGSSMGHQALQW
jgi:hypothetical protein